MYCFYICTFLENNIEKSTGMNETTYEIFIINQNDTNSPSMCLVLTEQNRNKCISSCESNFHIYWVLVQISVCCTIIVVFSRRGEIKFNWIQRTSWHLRSMGRSFGQQSTKAIPWPIRKLATVSYAMETVWMYVCSIYIQIGQSPIWWGRIHVLNWRTLCNIKGKL